ncbi:Uncharacterized protein HZ326_17774 [Fusarium oxysporum f. sp. albedinis]|nr:Uncharacterized protein HZ326_17774 [Fusarium oxysporum f. sp. albedinis]
MLKLHTIVRGQMNIECKREKPHNISTVDLKSEPLPVCNIRKSSHTLGTLGYLNPVKPNESIGQEHPNTERLGHVVDESCIELPVGDCIYITHICQLLKNICQKVTFLVIITHHTLNDRSSMASVIQNPSAGESLDKP